MLQFPLMAGTSDQAFHTMTGAEPDQGESAILLGVHSSSITRFRLRLG